MMKLLMCKDAPVYNITTQKLLNPLLAPGQISKNPTDEIFRIWSNSRYSSQTNIIARRLQGRSFGQGNRQNINIITRSLSLSDSYWIKNDDDDIRFVNISPYYSDFWKGEGKYKNQPIPTLYTDGMLNKYWLDKDILIKQSSKIEIESANLARNIGLYTVDINEYQLGFIAIKSFTSPDIMYEAADTSGLLDVADFTYQDIIDTFGEQGLDMIVFDAVIGNIDRHTGNFGFLKCANKGNYLGMAPLFDFDQALFEQSEDNYALIRRVIDFVKGTSLVSRVLILLQEILKQKTNSEFLKRAKIFKDFLYKQ